MQVEQLQDFSAEIAGKTSAKGKSGYDQGELKAADLPFLLKFAEHEADSCGFIDAYQVASQKSGKKRPER